MHFAYDQLLFPHLCVSASLFHIHSLPSFLLLHRIITQWPLKVDQRYLVRVNLTSRDWFSCASFGDLSSLQRFIVFAPKKHLAFIFLECFFLHSNHLVVELNSTSSSKTIKEILLFSRNFLFISLKPFSSRRRRRREKATKLTVQNRT